MANLVERYVHQVGRYLPQKDRAEIEAELRSMIQDKLEDRYAETPTEDEIVAVLKELGDPRQMAVSYSREQYLVGPEIYPYMMMVLRRGWLIVPSIVVGVHIIEALVATEPTNVVGLFIETLVGIFQALLVFSAIVVVICAIVQHSGEEIKQLQATFNPLNLPEVDDPRRVDRFETAFGIAFGTFFGVVLLYFMNVGGLTLRLNPTDPSEIIPVPMTWLTLLTVSSFAMVVLHLFVLRRNRWSLSLWITEMLLELVGAMGLYFVLFKPFVERILTTVLQLNDVPLIVNMPEILVVSTLVIGLISNGGKLVKLWNYKNDSLTSTPV